MPAHIEAFFDPVTCTISYLVYDQPGGHAAVIDPVLDYNPKSGRTHSGMAQRIVDFVGEQRLTVDWILETHAHADHLSAAQWLKARVGGRVGIGEPIRTVQRTFKALFNLGDDFIADGSVFDHLFGDDERFRVGSLEFTAMAVPGHTAADIAYRVEDAVFIGDTLFLPDVGSARCDFPGGNAHTLYRSVRRLLSLPPETRLYMCHDYPPNGRGPQWQTTVAEQRAANIHLRDGIGEDEFVAMRSARDSTLDMPVLMLPAIQINIRAGHFPSPEANGVVYLKIPLDRL